MVELNYTYNSKYFCNFCSVLVCAVDKVSLQASFHSLWWCYTDLCHRSQLKVQISVTRKQAAACFLSACLPAFWDKTAFWDRTKKTNNYVKKFSISDQITPISVLQNRNPSTVETESGLLTRGYDCFDLLFPMRLPMHSNSIKPDIMHVPA